MSGTNGNVAVVNARISIEESDEPEAVVIRGSEIIAAGSHDALRPLIDGAGRAIDVGGRRLIPGLIDSHAHVVRAGASWNHRVDWSELDSLEHALETIREAARGAPPGRWIVVVGGWHPGRFAEGRGPTIDELSSAAPHHPVYVQLLYEKAWLNHAALEALTDGPHDLSAAWFERADDGRLTGAVTGAPGFSVCLDAAGHPSATEQATGTVEFFRTLNSLGLVGALDPGGLGMAPESYRPLFEVWRKNELSLRIRLFVMPDGRNDEIDQIRDFVRYLHPRFGDDMLRIGGAGEILTMGCWDGEGVRPFEATGASLRVLEEAVRLLATNGWSVHQHAVLDETISRVLDVWEAVDADVPLRPLRFALAHAEPINEHNLERVRALGAGIAVQNRMIYRAADSARLWGDEVLRRSPPLRSILDMGIPLGAGTDATTVSPYNPWWSIWWLVTGASVDGAEPRHRHHRLSREEALAAYTTGSAWFSGEEGRRGRLRPGMLADLAVLSDDYYSVDADAIRDLRSDLTIVGGRVVHASASIDIGSQS